MRISRPCRNCVCTGGSFSNVLLTAAFGTGVARWHIFKPKIPIWVNFGGTCNGRCLYTYFMSIWSIFWPFGILCGHLVYFTYDVFWNIFSRFGMLYKEKSGNPVQDHCGLHRSKKPEERIATYLANISRGVGKTDTI
jgi:hypothetical protein